MLGVTPVESAPQELAPPTHHAYAPLRHADPVVGVVMTAFNSAAFIGEALASLRRQTFTNWECVVVDDGSVDATAAVVADIVAQDGRIRLLTGRARGGVSVARNAGLAALSPSVAYVALLDSDDFYLPDALGSLLMTLEHRPDAVGVFGLAEYADAEGKPILTGVHPDRQRSRRAVRPHGFADVALEADSTFADLALDGPIWPAAVGLHRRQVITSVGGFDPSFTRQGDWELYLRMSRQGPFPLLNQQVAWYRRHGGNLTGDLVETWYQQDRVRRKAWKSRVNTPVQRRTVARAARRVQLADAHRRVNHLMGALTTRRLHQTTADLASLVILTGGLVRPAPPRPSRWRVRVLRHHELQATLADR